MERIYNKEDYSILIVKDREFKIPNSSGFITGEDSATIRIFAEELSIDEIEEVFLNLKSTDYMLIKDPKTQDIYYKENGYNFLIGIQKKYKELYYKEDDIYLYYDIYELEIKKETFLDSFNQMRANLDYLSIMTGIDLEEE